MLTPNAQAWKDAHEKARAERLAARRAGAAWAKELDMIMEERAASVARDLFPDDFSDGEDCRAQSGREGAPCEICESRWSAWRNRVAQVHRALRKAL